MLWLELIKNDVQLIFSGNFTTAPSIKLKSVVSDGEHPAMLICSAYNFYPKQIHLTWLRNGQEVSEGVSYSDATDDGDLRYRIFSHLEYTPVSGETITCLVEHLRLSEPRLISHGELFILHQTGIKSRPIFKKGQWFNIIFIPPRSCRWLLFCRKKHSDCCWSLCTQKHLLYTTL